ncbi:MAG: hypothetical protein NT154_11130 [Verrucomicrobia bacterium]|nr:hypothetical protein [Verrucomicrobiota bacterium]
MSITPESSDSEIASHLRTVQQQQKDLEKIERQAYSPLKVRLGVLEALCRECLRLRKEVTELRARQGDKR